MTKSENMQLPIEGESKIEIFRKKEIRKTLHEGAWWFSVKDILEALTDTTDGNRYSRDLRTSDPGLRDSWTEITRTLPFGSGSGGMQNTTFIDVEGIFRLVQSVPTKKAEPFKKWLAKTAFERLQEIENPELAIKRAIAIYRSKGYDDDWIDARIRNKASREALTAEWEKRWMTDKIALLTDAISVGAFGIKTSEHKEYKNLWKSHPLRDNMTPLELTLTTLGEQTTREITKARDAKTFRDHMEAANSGGRIAGDARKKIEMAIGKPVISSDNYLTERQRINNAKESEYKSVIGALGTLLMADSTETKEAAEKPVKIDSDFDDLMWSLMP